MRFSGFRKFTLPPVNSAGELARYLTVELGSIFTQLFLGLHKLKLEDNFEHFQVELTIPAASELEIRNELRDVIPSRRLIVRGNGVGIADGDAVWTKDFVYLKNTSASSATFTVMFFK